MKRKTEQSRKKTSKSRAKQDGRHGRQKNLPAVGVPVGDRSSENLARGEPQQETPRGGREDFMAGDLTRTSSPGSSAGETSADLMEESELVVALSRPEGSDQKMIPKRRGLRITKPDYKERRRL